MEEKKNKDNKTIGQILSGGSSQKKKIVLKKKKPRTDGNNNPPSEKKQHHHNPVKAEGNKSEEKKSNTEQTTVSPVQPLKKLMSDRPNPIIGKLNQQKPPADNKANKPKEHNKPVHQQKQQHHTNAESTQIPKKESETTHPKQDSTQKTQPPPLFYQKVERNPIVSRPKKNPYSETTGNQTTTQTSHPEHKRPYHGQQTGDRRNYKGNNNNTQNKRPGSSSELIPPEIPPVDATAPAQNRKRSTTSNFDKNREKNNSKTQENAKFFKQIPKKTINAISASSIPKEISIMENIQVGELAKKMNLKPGEVISRLMKMGMMVTINNVIDSDTATLLASEYNCNVKIVSLFEETVIQEEEEIMELHIPRPPVVTIMGHVDHGKTKLLDTIRKSDVINTESGGITQHIGAYQVHTPNGIISFLDTPGHEAFTSMRARGASVTDIVILVVAADDGVKSQTVEAINHAKAANVPIIVAINKVDLPNANPEKVKQELANYGLQSEEWGGDTITCEISARENRGVDHLLEMVLLQAEMLKLTANPTRRAKGTIIEAKLDPGRGPIATVLIQNGTLKIGSPFLSGIHAGKVRAMFDDLGNAIFEAPPSCPVLVTGLDGVPQAGDPFDEIKDEKEARQISQHRKEYERIGQAASVTRVTLDNMNEIIQKGELKELKIIIKADVRGSAEAISEALSKLSSDMIKLTVIHSGTGAIIDSDVMLAAASNAIIVGFHVRANPRTLSIAEKETVQIKYYSIIYDIVDEIKAAMEGMLEPDKIEEVIGSIEIRDVFKISKLGSVAGCMVTKGKITRNSNVRVIRDNVVLFDGRLKSLKRVKDDVSEVLTGFECGILLDGYDDIKVGDEIEVYEIRTVSKKLV